MSTFLRIVGFLCSFMFLLGVFGGWSDSGNLVEGLITGLMILGLSVGLLAILGLLSIVWFGKWWK